MRSKTARVKLYRKGVMCFIPVAFDPHAVFGKVRAPVKVSLHGYTYRSTIFVMGGSTCIPLRRSHREAAGLKGDEFVRVTTTFDSETRNVVVPEDLSRALRISKVASARWRALSYTAKREHVEAIEGARRPETCARRVGKLLQSLQGANPQTGQARSE